ncbi:MAG: outer membrane protein [Xanthobacter sp.]
MSADLPPQLPTKALPAPQGSWTGFYIGSYVGSGLMDTGWQPGSGWFASNPLPLTEVTGASAGTMIGTQLGYNYQTGPWILGVEGDIGTGFLFSRTRCMGNWESICQNDTDYVATLAGRVGYALDSLLIYAKAGAAFTRNSYTVSGSNYYGQFTGSSFQSGWSVGAGAEMPLTDKLSAKVEYTYLDFGSSDVTLGNGRQRSTIPLSHSIQMLKLGLNWRPWDQPLPGNAPALPSPGRDWRGLYLGLHAGSMWGRNDWSNGGGRFANTNIFGHFPGGSDTIGLLGGGQIGYNVQYGPWVAGLEGSWSAADLVSYAQCGVDNNTGGNFACKNSISSLGSISGRLGQSFGNVLLYGKVGAAWVKRSNAAFQTTQTFQYMADDTRWGWMLGGGVEYALAQNISAFIEYNYYDFGDEDLTLRYRNMNATTTLNQRFEAVRMGLNYRLDWNKSSDSSAQSQNAGPVMPAGWTAEIGGRYFASQNRMQKDLMDPSRHQRLNSRLIYKDSFANSLETFFRFQQQDGFFLKGYAGAGTQSGGNLFDEDFPAEYAYSNTISRLDDGQLAYGALDIGYDVISNRNGSLGAYIGYRGMYQSMNGFGCWQIASDVICDLNSHLHMPAMDNGLGLSETESWQGAAIGLNSRMQLSQKLRLEVDAAYLPYVTRNSRDNHWFRADINPQIESGHGWGSQFEAVLTYAMTDRFDLGVGARYWYYKTSDASTQFPGVAQRSPMTFYSEVYGAFLQASYRFGDLPQSDDAAQMHLKAPEQASNWTSLYAGGTLGTGWGHSRYSSPFPNPVTGDTAQLGGALAGAQIGADYQMGAYVVGAEASLAWANITGTDTCYSTAPAGALSGFNCGSTVEALGTLTGRLGYAFDKALIYARGGFSWNRQNDAFNNDNFVGQILSNSSTNTGWTLGGGIEFALLPDLTMGLEYKHFDFGASQAFTTTAPPSLVGVNLAPNSVRLDAVNLSVNYRFHSDSFAR